MLDAVVNKVSMIFSCNAMFVIVAKIAAKAENKLTELKNRCSSE
jgi:hypothetical protein